MKRTVSGILIFTILLFFCAPFPLVSALDGDGAGETRPVLASSAGVYADPFLSGEPFCLLQEGDEVEIIADAGRTVVEVRLTPDNGEQRTGYMGRSAFEATEGWPGETVRRYVAEACISIGLMSAEIRYREDEFSLARYRAQIKDLYRLRSMQTKNNAAFPDFLLRNLREVGLVSEDCFACAEDIAGWAVSRERNVIVWDGEETVAAKDVTDRVRQTANGGTSASSIPAGTDTAGANTFGGTEVQAQYTAYYPYDDAMQGGYYDARGNLLDPSKNTCAAPASVPFGTQITIQGTGTWADGRTYTVTDRGGGIKIVDGVYYFDILMASAEECYAWGLHKGTAIIGGAAPAGSSGQVKSSDVSTLNKALRFAGDAKTGFPISVDSIVKYKNKFDAAVLDTLEPGDVLLLNFAENIVPYTASGQLSSQPIFSKEAGYCINEGVPRLYTGFDEVLICVGKGVSGEYLVLESDGSDPENVSLTALGSERAPNIRMVIRPTGCAKNE